MYIEQAKLKQVMPDGWDSKLEIFDRLMIWRVLQPQRLESGIAYYVANTIGETYAQPTNASIKDIYKDSDNRTPIIFVLSPGADPTASLLKFAT